MAGGTTANAPTAGNEPVKLRFFATLGLLPPTLTLHVGRFQAAGRLLRFLNHITHVRFLSIMSKAAPAKTSSSAPAVLAPDATTRKNVDLAVSAITKQFGEGSIMRLGDNNKMAVETVSTGSLAIDLTLGGKGLPRGRIIEALLVPEIHTWSGNPYETLTVCHTW